MTAVDWDVAAKVAAKVAGEDPFASSYHYDSLAPDFEEFTAQAEQLVSECTGLVSSAGLARARVTDRAGWVDANLKSFERLLRPLLNTMVAGQRGPFTAVGRKIAGAEVGALLGWMSTRVLGQYDLLIIEDEAPEAQDIVYYVGPNVVALEKKYGFPPAEFRLWLALHEVTHRMQFTGVPWLREHWLGLVEESLGSMDPDPKALMEAIKRTAEEIKSGSNPLDDGGLAAVFASPEQRELLDRMSGLMSLLEGHGDVTMNRAGAADIPSAKRFATVLSNRRNSAGGVQKLIQKLLGLEAKLLQYSQGEDFIEAVENHGGIELSDRLWEDPSMLPVLAEIRKPELWLKRVDAAATVS